MKGAVRVYVAMQFFAFRQPTHFSLLILIVGGCLLISSWGALANTQYTVATECKSCHQQEYQDWQTSHHYKAMQPATAETVLGDFSGVQLSFHGIESRMYAEGPNFFVETAGPDGNRARYEVKYTFGFEPLQQYLLEIEGGRLQALNIAWDSRPLDQGGQRWYHLQPEENITHDHPFFWAGHFQNWNSRCAECHVTNYEKGFDLESLTFKSRWSEMNVSCEACHGPAQEHLKLAQTGKLGATNNGFSRIQPKPLSWQYPKGEFIARAQGEVSSDHIDMCGRCHSLRMPLAEQQANANFHGTYQLQLLEQGAYFADGQIQDEVFVLGSFLQSKMHQQGVTCHDCHNPHTGRTKIEGNGLCAQCHMPAKYDNEKHHHHAQSSAGAECVSCHMPARTYMGVDDRRDHSFTIPRPQLSAETGAPNACVGCHEDKDNAWAAAALKSWGIDTNRSHWSQTHQQVRNFNPAALAPIADWLREDQLSAVVKATILSQLIAVPSQQSLMLAQEQLKQEDPLIRRAAVVAISAAPPNLRWQMLSPYLQDDNRQVRFAVMSALVGSIAQLPASERAVLEKSLEEYREMLSYTLDSPATQLSIAELELASGNDTAALKAYQRALEIAPAYVPALVNLSEYHRRRNQKPEAEALLAKALEVTPESAMIQHAFGLHLIREKDYSNALKHLGRAIDSEGAQPRHAYVYSVALDSTGKSKEAIRTLINANKRWPNQYDILLNLVVLMDKTGQTMSIQRYLEALASLAPNSPQVRQLQRKYQRKPG